MSQTLKVGDKAPEFTLETGSGETLKLKDLKGKSVILYFYPKDDTSGCTKEACDFRDALPAITKPAPLSSVSAPIRWPRMRNSRKSTN